MSEWNKKEEEYKKMVIFSNLVGKTSILEYHASVIFQLKKEKEHIRDLSSQMWDVSDKYLQLKQKYDVKGTPGRFRAFSVVSIELKLYSE